MAGSSFVKKPRSQTPAVTHTVIPPRATRQLEAARVGEEVLRTDDVAPRLPVFDREPRTRMSRIVDEYEPRPLQRHIPWLRPLLLCMTCVVVFAGVLLAAGILQRRGDTQVVNYQGGSVYSIQVGGSQAGTWENSTPLPAKTPLPNHPGPYSVMGKPSLTVDFMNQVLASYNSPATGKAQALYNLGVQYGIDPAFALAFFMHESSFGTQGEARSSLSLGNLRCIPNARCQDNYAWFGTWEQGFEAWYQLIRNLYIAQWGLTTVDQIIPKYAPAADHNNEQAYIDSLKHSLDTWHAGIVRP